ncbi:MAG TPA: PspA/IM30 family protein [Fimbriimonadaceae bacterium]|nr:PspA/IM30 family protein [Fimbriimonadaceae bacterium]HRJ33201.1 PspA/IM30 family protein [Fimbriimonadaceae bacterium]
MKRFFQWLKALFNRGMDKLEDPDLMLDQARRDMQTALIQNREKAVQAITQKNRLQQILDEQEKKAAMLQTQAETALRGGNRELAKQFLREKSTIDSTIEQYRTALAQAVESVDAVKLAIKRQEEEVKRKTAEALALKAQWKQSQIQSSITKALEGLTFENEYEGSFAAARDRIKDKQAEAAARQEMFAGSIQGKMMAIEDQAADYAAEEELKKLEERLGMGAPSATTTPLAVEATSDVAAQLEELEKRINQGQNNNNA